jgi:hypothetical protein
MVTPRATPVAPSAGWTEVAVGAIVSPVMNVNSVGASEFPAASWIEAEAVTRYEDREARSAAGAMVARRARGS